MRRQVPIDAPSHIGMAAKRKAVEALAPPKVVNANDLPKVTRKSRFLVMVKNAGK